MNRGFFTYAGEEEKGIKVAELSEYNLDDLWGARTNGNGSMLFSEYLTTVCNRGDTVYMTSFKEIGYGLEEQLDVLRYIMSNGIRIKLANSTNGVITVCIGSNVPEGLLSLIQMACATGWIG